MINNNKMKSFSENSEVNLRSRVSSVKSKERHAAKNMSPDTKGFIQKICYRKTASIDMTQYGFINDSKVNPMNYMIKPLREQLEKICVKSASIKDRKTSPTPPRTEGLEVVSPVERKPKTCTPKSAMSDPGTHSSCTRLRKVRIQNDPCPVPAVIKEKKVRLVSPRRSKGENVANKNDVRPRKMNLINNVMIIN